MNHPTPAAAASNLADMLNILDAYMEMAQSTCTKAQLISTTAASYEGAAGASAIEVARMALPLVTDEHGARLLIVWCGLRECEVSAA